MANELSYLLVCLSKQANPKKSLNYFEDTSFNDDFIFNNVNLDPAYNLLRVYAYALRLVTCDIDLIRNVTYIVDWANVCECGYYITSVDPCKMSDNALNAMIELGIVKPNCQNVNWNNIDCNWNKNGFTRSTAHNGTQELMIDYLMCVFIYSSYNQSTNTFHMLCFVDVYNSQPWHCSNISFENS